MVACDLVFTERRSGLRGVCLLWRVEMGHLWRTFVSMTALSTSRFVRKHRFFSEAEHSLGVKDVGKCCEG